MQLKQLTQNLEAHAKALTDMPASEQYIGAMQMVIATALLDLKKYFETISK